MTVTSTSMTTGVLGRFTASRHTPLVQVQLVGKHDGTPERFVQVWALDMIDNGLVRIRDGHADELRAACASGRLVCPMPGCDDRRFEPHADHPRGSSFVRAVFHHVNKSTAHEPESWHHFVGKLLVQEWLLKKGWHAELEKTVIEPKRRPDVTAIGPDGSVYGIEVQYSRISPELWRQRTDDMVAAGMHPIWLWGHTRTQFRPDRYRSDAVTLSALQTDEWHAGRRTHWIDPDAVSIRSLHPDETPQRFRSPRFVTDPMRSCSLEPGELTTPADALFARGERVRVERAEAQRRAAEARERQRMARIAETERRRAEQAALTAAQRASREQYRDKRRAEEAEVWLRSPIRQGLIEKYGSLPVVLTAECDREHNIFRHPEQWRTEVFLDLIQGHVGQTYPFQKFARKLLGGRELGDRVFDALRPFMFALRRAGYVDFASTAWYVTSDVDVLADLNHPPETSYHFDPWEPLALAPSPQQRSPVLTDQHRAVRDLIAKLAPGESTTTSEIVRTMGLPSDAGSRRAVIGLLIDLKFAGEVSVERSRDLFDDGPIENRTPR